MTVLMSILALLNQSSCSKHNEKVAVFDGAECEIVIELLKGISQWAEL